MNKQTLKEQLKPPFHYFSEHIYDKNASIVCGDIDGFNIGHFIEAALNEKCERDFSEPLRWIRNRSLGVDWIDCPKCKHGLQEGTKDLNFCPFCGQRLLPPEGE